MFTRRPPPYVIFSALSTFTVLVLLACHAAVRYDEKYLSPSGCEMSWMSPSYILQSGFNTTWTPLATRYSLWLYQEVGYGTGDTLSGYPALFIPGNAGSSQQIRSIASSITRQLYDSPYVPSAGLREGNIRPIDVFAVEFNEDLSALHGPTILSQKAYVAAAIDYILSLYPAGPNRPDKVLLLGHSMGGLVSISLLPSDRVSAIITMSTPASLPPARLDRRMEHLYGHVLRSLYPPLHHTANGTSSTPVLSLCGGATDLQIPSESCYLPQPSSSSQAASYRKTVFTSGLEGAWTGVGHNEMVWCHQVRWRVARAALELVGQTSVRDRELTLDRWLTETGGPERGSRAAQPEQARLADLAPEYTVLDIENQHELRIPSQAFGRHLENPEAHMYLLPLKSLNEDHRLTVLIARGTLVDISSNKPKSPDDLQVELFSCHRGYGQEIRCKPLPSANVNLTPIPLPPPSGLFPAPKVGIKPEDVGFVYTSTIAREEGWDEAYVSIRISGRMRSAHSGLVARLDDASSEDHPLTALGRIFGEKSSLLAPYLGASYVTFGNIRPLITAIHVPFIRNDALLVYSVRPHFAGSCSAADHLIPPILHHISSDSESHFHPLLSSSPILLHSHSSGPFLEPNLPGLFLRLYSTGNVDSCTVTGLNITVAWRASVGRWALRYWSSLVVWGIGVVSSSMALSWFRWEQGAPFPTLFQSHAAFASSIYPTLSITLVALSCLPMPKDVLLGMSGQPIYSVLAPLCLLLATGFVGLMIVGLEATLRVIRLVARIRAPISGHHDTTAEAAKINRTNIAAIAIMLACVATLIPYHVAFVTTWLILLWTCASCPGPVAVFREQVAPNGSNAAFDEPTYIPLMPYTTASTPIEPASPVRSRRSPQSLSEALPEIPPAPTRRTSDSALNLVKHILLLQTLLIPLEAPVLVVWVRTLASAGYTTPFDGDHNILMALPWLVLMEAVTDGAPWRRVRRRWLQLLAPLFLTVLAIKTVVFGLRYTYGVYEGANVVIAGLLLLRLM
ncbi:GPI inositol deacylase [Tulasnella sp. JGI-2019a]|nr:GPI inositol deacylase [Tulasnella sp. JGI-2019a]